MHTATMWSIIDNYESLQATMEIASRGSDGCSRHASGILALMDKFKVYFGLKLVLLIFSITGKLITYSTRGRYKYL